MNNYAIVVHTSGRTNSFTKMAFEVFEILKVLMWKHLVVRMRRFIHTPVELLSGMVYFLILFLVKDFLISEPPSHIEMNNIQDTVSTRLINSNYK